MIKLRGIRLEIVDRGAGRPFVFLHPGEGLDVRAPVLDRLMALGRVIAPSHPGFGASDLPAEFTSVDDLAYCYLDLFDALSLRDAVLIGASFGGWIAAEIAVRNTRHLSHLVLADTLGARFSTDPATVEIADFFSLTRTEVERRALVNPARWRSDHSALPEDALHVLARNRESFCLFGWAPYMHNPLLGRWLHRIDVPTLVLWGEGDGIVAADYGRAWAAAIPHASFQIIPDAGHFPHIEQPEALVRAVEAFVARAPAARKSDT
jgi:pimeloyl-ACP methyl ester carboxylesterase